MLDKADAIFKDQVEVDGDFVQGDKKSIEKLVVNIYNTQGAPSFSDDVLQTQLKEFRRHLIDRFKYLDFKGIEGIAEAMNNASGLRLEDVYVPVRARPDRPEGETWHRIGGRVYCGAKAMVQQTLDSESMESELRKAEASALPVEQWMSDQSALMILGDPGSGKSTTLKRLALGLAQRDDAPLPVLVPLNAYSQRLEEGEISFEDYLCEYFSTRLKQLDRNKLSQLFTEALQQEKAFILLDGLDEVGNNRGEVVRLVEHFVQRWIPDPDSQAKTGNRVVVTSRFVGYRAYPVRNPRWKTVALNDWNREEINRFFHGFTFSCEMAWKGAEQALKSQAQQAAKTEQEELGQVLDHAPSIRRLAGNPLLASLLVLIKRQGRTLPNQRVELYKLYMETLLRSWNRNRSLDGVQIGPEIEFSPTQKLLAKLALHLRQTNPQGGIIVEEQMLDYLRNYYVDDAYSGREADEMSRSFLQSVHKYSNLLIEKGHQQYGFIHLTFEEYLAGFGLAVESERKLCQLLPQYLQQKEHWRETLLLAFGVMALVNSNADKANTLLEALLEGERPEPEHVIFAAEVLLDVGVSALGNRTRLFIQKHLLRLVQGFEQAVEPRAQAGRLLSQVGDPRSGVTVKRDADKAVIYQGTEHQHAIPDIDWVRIPAGEFMLGDEQLARLEQDYFMSRYPVTNAQYQCFIDAGMYEDEVFWREQLPDMAYLWWQGEVTSEKLAEQIKEESLRESYLRYLRGDKERKHPRFWREERWNLANHPVVGVSWYEALAFSYWLNNMQPNLLLPQGVQHAEIYLPTELQWEYAARTQGNFIYPWGNEPEPTTSLANYDKSGLGRTSMVGLYPVSQGDLADMAGNVWEWTTTQPVKYEEWERYQQEADDLNKNEMRVFRGGAWFDPSDLLRAAVRSRNGPDNRDDFVGFRLLLTLPG